MGKLHLKKFTLLRAVEVDPSVPQGVPQGSNFQLASEQGPCPSARRILTENNVRSCGAKPLYCRTLLSWIALRWIPRWPVPKSLIPQFLLPNPPTYFPGFLSVPDKFFGFLVVRDAGYNCNRRGLALVFHKVWIFSSLTSKGPCPSARKISPEKMHTPTGAKIALMRGGSTSHLFSRFCGFFVAAYFFVLVLSPERGYPFNHYLRTPHV